MKPRSAARVSPLAGKSLSRCSGSRCTSSVVRGGSLRTVNRYSVSTKTIPKNVFFPQIETYGQMAVRNKAGSRATIADEPRT
jgi:hypothetical protein